MPAMTEKQREARRQKRLALEKEKFTREEKERWADMLHRTWHAIGPDAEASFAEGRQRITRSIIVEIVCDANRVQEYGDMTDEEYDFLGAIYHRPTFQKWARGELNYC